MGSSFPPPDISTLFDYFGIYLYIHSFNIHLFIYFDKNLKAQKFIVLDLNNCDPLVTSKIRRKSANLKRTTRISTYTRAFFWKETQFSLCLPLLRVLHLRGVEEVLQFEQKFISLHARVVRSFLLCSKTLLLKFPKFPDFSKLN